VPGAVLDASLSSMQGVVSGVALIADVALKEG
jgi:hypothetical protein